ncbi:MAG TPA: cation-translocating P-type ATPase [Rhodocyclaceae bacterium]|nr:cation-translocating P-type ATPase [Rhodocyclaceae bacterium]
MQQSAYPAGLTTTEATARQVAEGPNELEPEQRRGFSRIAGEVASEPMFLLLLGAGSIYLLMGDLNEALMLLAFVCIIMAVTILQERHTERALEALRDLSSPRALAIRDGNAIRIAGRDVVRDDILILGEGDRVPADGHLLAAHELSVDESLLTGESLAVAKCAAAQDERGNTKIFAGTLITSGQGIMCVSAIGAATELGRIGKSLQSIDNETSPLQREIGELTKRLALIAGTLCLLFTALYVAIRGGWLDGLLAGITLAMGILPQEFPVILIIFLALGARRIAQQRVLTRRLGAIETLGETTVLCVDKTGTLTQNHMAVAALAVDGQQFDVTNRTALEVLPEHFHELLEYSVLASETEPLDPMEQAVHRMANEYLANTEHLHTDWNLTREYERLPDLPAMSHLWQVPGRHLQAVACKGAPEAIADLCHLDAAQTAQVTAQVAVMAERGLRVLGVARAEHRSGTFPDLQHDFAFEYLGLVGLADPLRTEVPGAVEECRQAGIRVVMITGDHPHTARTIAVQAGIDDSRMLTGAELLDDKNIVAQIAGVGIFARVTPQQKLRIVEALKARGEIVAMTGDGVNDAPALKAAHIGIAMGRRGTDVAREAASLVLLNDDFGAIVHAIRLGRRIFRNLRQAMIYTLAVHVPIVVLSIMPLLLGLPLMLAPIHIAFLELIINPACSIVFEAEANEEALMRMSPRTPEERLIASSHIILSMIQGALTAGVAMLLYWFLLNAGRSVEETRGLAFVALIVADSMLVLSSRSLVAGFWPALRGLNPASYWVLGGTALALLAVTRQPLLAGAFAFTPTAWRDWLIACLIGCATFALFEFTKACAAAAVLARLPVTPVK